MVVVILSERDGLLHLGAGYKHIANPVMNESVGNVDALAGMVAGAERLHVDLAVMKLLGDLRALALGKSFDVEEGVRACQLSFDARFRCLNVARESVERHRLEVDAHNLL